ncbi:ABC transporter permease subunit [Neobacillus sp. LXY-1]|uniref:ABC transporter permease subunit n=1 Tax=Neobacillus sp. LXY-1 TaxID=3379133 RepID=UPI003EDEEE0D
MIKKKLFSVNYSLYIGFIFCMVLIFLAIFGPSIAPHTLTETLKTSYDNGKIYAPPLDPFESKDYPLGTDKWGYDLYSMVLYGIRYTLFISIAVTIIKMTVGSFIGLYAGMLRKTPQWIEAFETAWSYIPLFLILFFFLNPITFNQLVDSDKLIYYFIILAAAVSTPSIISSVRKKSKEISKSAFIEAAQTLGASRHRMVWKHIFPQLKESLLVMFVLEVIHVITLMGQLALMHIFIGGTIVRKDPLEGPIYLSITKEIAGLVGSARGNIYSTSHILYIPLLFLVFTIIALSLLANGLKNRFQSNYSRTPWIKTGFEPNVMPKRKTYVKKIKGWLVKGEMIGLIFLFVLFVGAGWYVTIHKDDDIGVKNFSAAKYDLKLKMNKNGLFHSTANINVTNKSKNEWKDIVFYFIPNVFSESGASKLIIKEIKVNNQKAVYSLKRDSLKIKLDKNMGKDDHAEINVTYSFTVPEEGSRFSKVQQNYYLAQWYPMLATYQNGKWNKEDYQKGLETYHTDFSDYSVQYDIPKGYSIISTADRDAGSKENSGEVKIEKVREFFIAIVKGMQTYTTDVNGVEVRLYTKKDQDKKPQEVLGLAKRALSFYQDKIGEYPLSQLDIVLDKGENMEYPGIVTVNPYIEDEHFFNMDVVHEVAHQYFSGVVSNDPYHEAWIDEGMSEFATNVFYYLGEHEGAYQSQSLSINRMKKIEELGLGRQVSNVPLSENKNSGYIYGQPALKLFSLVQDKYRIRDKDFKTVLSEYLADYYKRFKYKEVDTAEFIRFTKDYFQVPQEYFNDWLEVPNRL